VHDKKLCLISVTSMHNLHPLVKQYIDRQESPQKEICQRVRKILLSTIPDIEETFKNGVPWYGKFYIAGMKDSVNIGFSVTGLNSEEVKFFKGAGKYMRHIKIHTLDDLDEKKLKSLFKLVWEKSSCYEQVSN